MPRKKSVILSPTEKKEIIKALKAEKQSAKSGIRVVNSEWAIVARERKAQDKAFTKRTKEYAKQLVSVETQLDKLAPPKSAPILSLPA